MYASTFFAVWCVIISNVIAVVVVNRREIERNIETDVVFVTIPVTTSLWVGQSESMPAYPAQYAQYAQYAHVNSSELAASCAEDTGATFRSSSLLSEYSTLPSHEVFPGYGTPVSTTLTSGAPTNTINPTAVQYATPPNDGGNSCNAAALGASHTGDLTWYQDGLGACGWTNGPSDHIVAISHSIFDACAIGSNPNNNKLCGKTVTITGKDGSLYKAKIVDRCVGCKPDDLDLSEHFFDRVTDNGNGRVSNMSWKFD